MDKDFYLQDTLQVAKSLLGKTMVRRVDGHVLKAKIVETEAYMGDCDKASHAYPMKETPRTKVMFENGGVAYIYLIYGMYYCLNIVTKEQGMPHAILIRGVEPLNEWDTISHYRFQKNYEALSSYQRKNITNGPGKLCKAYQIDMSLNGISLNSEALSIEDGDTIEEKDIVSSKRINIDYAEEAKEFLWRFYVKDNVYVSKG